MKYAKVIILCLFWIGTTLAGCACEGTKDPTIRRANSTMLNNPFTLSTATQNNISVPVANFYRRLPGCYLACYSKTSNELEGLLRINGLYLGSTCQPQGFFFRDLATLPNFEKLCDSQISKCNGNCLAQGDTGRWLGIDPQAKV